MRKRLSRLENSILSMIESNGSNQFESPGSMMTASTDTTSETPSQAGPQKMSSDSRSTHWNTILNEVSYSISN
jgi:hypothetical protein